MFLEGLLSADNAMSSRYWCSDSRAISSRKHSATASSEPSCFGSGHLFAAHIIQLSLVKLLGRSICCGLCTSTSSGAAVRTHARGLPAGEAVAGPPAFWATVVRVELTDFVFAIDSILVGVAMSPKLWVVLTGGILGIIAMRDGDRPLLTVVRRYPALVDGAFVIIAWVGIKLLIE